MIQTYPLSTSGGSGSRPIRVLVSTFPASGSIRQSSWGACGSSNLGTVSQIELSPLPKGCSPKQRRAGRVPPHAKTPLMDSRWCDPRNLADTAPAVSRGGGKPQRRSRLPRPDPRAGQLPRLRRCRRRPGLLAWVASATVTRRRRGDWPGDAPAASRNDAKRTQAPPSARQMNWPCWGSRVICAGGA